MADALQAEREWLRRMLDSKLGAEPDELGCTDWVEHEIDVGNVRPIKQQCYPYLRKKGSGRPLCTSERNAREMSCGDGGESQREVFWLRKDARTGRVVLLSAKNGGVRALLSAI